MGIVARPLPDRIPDRRASRKYGQFVGVPSRAQLERFFFFNDADRALIEQRRGDHNRLGFGVQLGTVRFLGVFLSDPLNVPEEVLGYVAGQLEIDDPSIGTVYGERGKDGVSACLGDPGELA